MVHRSQQRLLSLLAMYRTAATERLEALEAVSVDRDAWETRYRQLATEHATVAQSPLPHYRHQRITDLERTLLEKEQVIRELHAAAELRREKLEEIDRVLQQERAEREKERQAAVGHTAGPSGSDPICAEQMPGEKG